MYGGPAILGPGCQTRMRAFRAVSSIRESSNCCNRAMRFSTRPLAGRPSVVLSALGAFMIILKTFTA
jgi:hypothetical protein